MIKAKTCIGIYCSVSASCQNWPRALKLAIRRGEVHDAIHRIIIQGTTIRLTTHSKSTLYTMSQFIPDESRFGALEGRVVVITGACAVPLCY